MKTKSMKLPELSETSEVEITPTCQSTEDQTTPLTPPTSSPLPPRGSPNLQRRLAFQDSGSSSSSSHTDRPPPTAKVMPQISITGDDGEDITPARPPDTNGSDPSTPFALPQAFLKKLGLAVEDDDKDVSVDQLSEKEVESKFVTLSLAFKTDKMTLDQRVIVQERARDLAEQNVDVELQGLRDAAETLNELVSDLQVREVLERIRQHIEILEISAAKVSSRAEVFGAVQQERRLCKAMEVMVQYTENLRRIRAKEESEVQEARKVLSERSHAGFGLDIDAGPARRSMSVCGLPPGVRAMRRRSEVALPRILGGGGIPNASQGPKARFQSAVASTTMQHAVTATMRRASMDRQRSMSVAVGSAPFASNGGSGLSGIGTSCHAQGLGLAGDSPGATDAWSRVAASSMRPRKVSQTTLESTVAEEDEGAESNCASESTNPNSEAPTPARRVSHDEHAYRKGFEQGLKAKLSDQLSELREQQNSISRSLEDVMDRVDQGEEEEAMVLANPTRFESALALGSKLRQALLSYDWRSNKTTIRNLAGGLFLLLALLVMLLSPPVPATTLASNLNSQQKDLPQPTKT